MATSSTTTPENTDHAAAGFVELTIDEAWSAETRSIDTALRDYYGAELAGNALPPPASPTGLRSRLRAAAPGLAEITDRTRRVFDTGAVGVLVPKLGLARHEVDQRRRAVFALAVLLGDVTETEPVDHRVVWDLQTQPEELRQFSRFSQADGEAQYHTDSTIVPVPERYFLLYAVQQAHCGGGVSMLRDGRVVTQQLTRTPQGRAALAVLSQTKLPIRVPKWSRAKYGYPEREGYQYLPVIAEQPLWRWRRDKIERGLVKHPECDTQEVRDALRTVDELLTDPTGEIRQVIPTDGIVIIDNHVAFHGRTAFTDPNRHLLRIRFN